MGPEGTLQHVDAVAEYERDLTPVERPVQRTSRTVQAWGVMEAWLARDDDHTVTFAVSRTRGLLAIIHTASDAAPVVEQVSPVEDPLTAVLRAIGKSTI
jgi:hypothetical protein